MFKLQILLTLKSKLIELLALKGFKFVITLVLVFQKIESQDKTNYDNFYSSSKAEIVINESDIDDMFKSIYTTIITSIQKSLRKGSGWIIDPVIDHTLYQITKRIRPSKKRLD